jgi:hypothetical protein
MSVGLRGTPVAKKKPDASVTKKVDGTTMIRVSVTFAEAIRRAASFEDKSIAEFADTHLMAAVLRRYRDEMVDRVQKMEGQNQ